MSAADEDPKRQTDEHGILRNKSQPLSPDHGQSGSFEVSLQQNLSSGFANSTDEGASQSSRSAQTHLSFAGTGQQSRDMVPETTAP